MRTELREEILRVLDETLEGRGWDVPPSFLVLTINVDDDGELALRVSELPMDADDPPGRLLAMANRVVDMGADELARLGGADAVAFACEAWALWGGPDDDMEEFKRIEEERRVHEHPRRVEVRIVSLVAVDSDGLSQLMRERESGKITIDHEGAPDGPDLFAGRVPEALTMLAGHKRKRPSLN